jgi:ribosomal protein S18 acetylase RimI-like enzyme
MKLLDTNNEILFQTMRHSDIEETASCISQAFSSSEILTKALEISFNEFYQFAVPVCQKVADEEISIIAKDRITGEVIGFIISEDFITINSDSPEGIDSKFEPIFSLLSELEENYRSRHAIAAGEVLHIFLFGVSEKYTKRHIATTLVRENLKLAKQHGFEIAIAEATGEISQHIFRTLGFTEEFAIEYRSYKFQGQQSFSSIENPPSCLLMSSPI